LKFRIALQGYWHWDNEIELSGHETSGTFHMRVCQPYTPNTSAVFIP